MVYCHRMCAARRGPPFRPFLVLPLFLLAFTACTSQMSLDQVLELPRAVLVPERFPGATRLLDGFDPPDPGAPDSAPERALFGLELDARGEVQRWLLLIEAKEPPAGGGMHQKVNAPGGSFDYVSRRRQIQVTLCDGDGQRLGESTVYAPWDFL